MSMFSLHTTLPQLLSEFQLSHLQQTLREKEFDFLYFFIFLSILSLHINLCLVDKCRFKRALKSVNIPKHSVCYKIVNKEEQQYIVNIEKSLERMQNLIVNDSVSGSNPLTKRYKHNENVIHSSFDTFISTLNQQRDALLKPLTNVYTDAEYRNKEIITHLNTAKSIKQQCQQIIMKDIHQNDIDSRTNTIKNLNDECLNKEKMITDIIHRNISNKSQQTIARNSCNHTFSIPIYCGKTSHYKNREADVWSDPHVTKLKTSNNQRIVCGGLSWDIYIHPNQGEDSNGFALSVFPVKRSMVDKLPDNYKLKYTVFTSLNIAQMDDDEQTVSRFDGSWHRELSDVIYDANVSGIEWQWTMERLPFSTTDLIEYNGDNDNGCFNLYVQINTSFIMTKGAKSSQYNGVLGAILLDSESVMEEQRKEIDTLKDNKDEFIMKLETANKLNFQLTVNLSKMIGDMEKYALEIQEVRDAYKQSVEETGNIISRLQEDIVNKNAEMSQSMNQITTLKERQRANDTYIYTVKQITQQNTMSNPYNIEQQQRNTSRPSPPYQARVVAQPSLFSEPATVTAQIAPNGTHFQATNTKPTDVPREEKKQEEEDPNDGNVFKNKETLFSIEPFRFFTWANAFKASGDHQNGKEDKDTDNKEKEVDSTDVITDIMDASWQHKFEHRPVRVKRYDEKQGKWRGRGTGQLMVYYNKEKNIGKMVFTDEKHNKTRLLQYINGGTHCTYAWNDGDTSKDKLQWYGSDYTMDTKQPMITKWQIAFMNDDTAAKAFMKVFNDLIDAYNNSKDFNHNDDEKASMPSAKPFRFDINEKDNEHAFSWNMPLNAQTGMQWANVFKGSEDNRKNTLGSEGQTAENDKQQNNTNNVNDNGNCTFKPIVSLSEVNAESGHENDTMLEHKENEIQSTFKPMEQQQDEIVTPTNDNRAQDVSSVTTKDNGSDDKNGSNAEEQSGFALDRFSFANNDCNDEQQNALSFDSFATGDKVSWGEFNFDNLIREAKRQNTMGSGGQTTENDKQENNIDNVNDNGNYTLEPIVSLSEVDVKSGHENETLLKTFDVIKLYRWGKDVSSNPCWKNRASKTSLKFYQDNENGKIRIVCRENITNKLRLNQMVTPDCDSVGKLKKKTEKQISWAGFDKTIEEEDEDEGNGYCLFVARFADEKIAHEFFKLYKSSQNNKSLKK